MIVVALSGGVDSATVAGLLVEQGRRVVGVSMRLYDARGTSASVGGRCCGPRDLEDARRVAAHLGIPFYIANYEDEFRARVIDATIESFVFEITGNTDKINQFIDLMRPLGLVEVSRTGVAAIGRGPEGM